MGQTLLELGYIPTEVDYTSPKEFVLIADLPVTARPFGRRSLKPSYGEGKSCGTKDPPPLRGRVHQKEIFLQVISLFRSTIMCTY